MSGVITVAAGDASGTVATYERTGELRWSADGVLQEKWLVRIPYRKRTYGGYDDGDMDYKVSFQWLAVPTEGK